MVYVAEGSAFWLQRTFVAGVPSFILIFILFMFSHE